MAIMEEKIQVTPPKLINIWLREGHDTHIGEVFMTNKLPAVTIVAAWIKAETGVGPSIASGSQTWNIIWALLQKTESRNQPHAEAITNLFSENRANPFKHSNEENPILVNNMVAPTIKLTSPSLLTIIALNDAVTASSLSCQKLISKKLHIPIPSHPKKNWNKELATTKIFMNPIKAYT